MALNHLGELQVASDHGHLRGIKILQSMMTGYLGFLQCNYRKGCTLFSVCGMMWCGMFEVMRWINSLGVGVGVGVGVGGAFL